MNMKWYAVRCCCTPQKIFGFIRLEDNLKTAKVKLRSGQMVEVQIKQSCNFTHSVLAYADEDVIQRTYEAAIYSEDRPIQFWRQVEGFMEIA